MKYFLFLTTVLLFLSSKVNSEVPVFVYDGSRNALDGKYIGIYEDATNLLTIEDVLNIQEFDVQSIDVPNLMISSSSFWAKFEVYNNSDYENLFIEYAYPIVDIADLYIIHDNGEMEVQEMGENIPISKREYKHPSFVYSINIPVGESQTFYLNIQNGQQIMLPLNIGHQQSIYNIINSKDIYSSIYFGIILVMLFYNLFIYASTRDRSYLFYTIYILSAGLTHLSHHGFTYKIFWPSYPLLSEITVALSPAFIGIATILFVNEFLQTKSFSKRKYRLFQFVMVSYIIAITLFVFDMKQASYQLSRATAMILGVSIIVTAIPIARSGYRPAKYFLTAWTIFIASVFVFIFKDLGILPYNTLTVYCLEIGASIELILLSFALADRMNIMKKEKEESQARALEILEENERIIREQNITLEKKVTERTFALQESNENLSTTLSELKNTQSQLVDAEKMASLGQLTAGIAHEINNPINFVVSNINPLKRDVKDLIELLDKYAEINEETDIKEKLAEIKALKEETDIDYVLEEIDMLLKGMEDGADRTAEIVKGLRSFSRLDETELKNANLNESLDSTLLLLKSSIGTKINIVKDYDKEIKPIECYSGKLNQLFMNMLNNAIQAVNKKKYPENEQPEIKVSSKNSNEMIIIAIGDNGIGMDEETKKRIFEPFYTTKGVGEGTGLGMSIVYNIIEKHNGKIEIDTELGKGTTFNIYIPKNQSQYEQKDNGKLDEIKNERKDRLREGLKHKIK